MITLPGKWLIMEESSKNLDESKLQTYIILFFKPQTARYRIRTLTLTLNNIQIALLRTF